MSYVYLCDFSGLSGDYGFVPDDMILEIAGGKLTPLFLMNPTSSVKGVVFPFLTGEA